ncbi:centrosomal protein of 128 kDa-like isoform X4 [Hoplias malabaricus]|uniref:centrosomal protein of 128 kDa-like isoform X4 n=1 Tax=Hoplias malabaricus TaxID=27720 RepID=UPI003461B5F6
MELSSGSEICSNSREHRSRDGDTQHRRKTTHVNNLGIAEKICDLTNTLQDTSANLNKVDRMLDQYREHTDSNDDAIATLRESLADSVHQLQNQGLKTSAGACSTTFSTLNSRSLDDDNTFDGQHHNSWFHLGISNRRKSRSATMCFRDPCQAEEQIHSLQNALRDLRNDQLQLEHEIDQEILMRNRSDNETRRMLVDLTSQIQDSPLEEQLSLRLERRLQKIENEMQSQRQVVSEKQCKRQHGSLSNELQKDLKRCDMENKRREDSYRNRLLRSECENCKLGQDLEHARKQLDISEGGHDILHHQMEAMWVQLQRSEGERAQLQRKISLLLLQNRNLTELHKNGAAQLGSSQGGTAVENEPESLRMHFSQSNDSNEVQALRRSLECKEKEKKQLAIWIEASMEREGILRQQMEDTRKKLAEVLGHVAQCEEKVTEAKRQNLLLNQLKEENQKLREQLEDLEHQRERKQCTLLELQASINHLISDNENLKSRLAEADSLRREQENSRAMAEKEKASLDQQLQLEREAHHKEIEHLRMPQQDYQFKQNQSMLKTQRLYQERETLKEFIKDLKAVMLTSVQDNDRHHWLAEMKTKLQWLCNELHMHEVRKNKLSRTVEQCSKQMKTLRQSRDSEQQKLLVHISQLEELLQDAHLEKQAPNSSDLPGHFHHCG